MAHAFKQQCGQLQQPTATLSTKQCAGSPQHQNAFQCCCHLEMVSSPALDECCFLCCDDGFHYLSLDQDLAIMNSNGGTLQEQWDTPRNNMKCDELLCLELSHYTLLHVYRQALRNNLSRHIVRSCHAQPAGVADNTTFNSNGQQAGGPDVAAGRTNQACEPYRSVRCGPTCGAASLLSGANSVTSRGCNPNS